MQSSCTLIAIGVIAFAGGVAAPALADTATLVADRDNTLYDDGLGVISNGSGTGFFVGRTAGGNLRRGLIHFDLDTIPCGSTINSVRVTLHMTMAISGPEPISLHRALADWGEGASVATGGGGGGGAGGPAAAGDATWFNTFYPGSLWATPGGDFDPTASATQSVWSTGAYVWGTNAAIVADVQQWVDEESSNNGWVLLTGFENISATAKRFGTRENLPALRPTVAINYTPPSGCAADLNGDVSVGFADLNVLLANWGTCSGCAGDLDCNGTVGFADLSQLLGAWGPCP